MKYEIAITKTQNPKPKPDPSKLTFGETFTDHMFLMDYDKASGWRDARIVPYGPICLDPAAMVLHYAQELFEGLKTYLGEDGGVRLFRPDMNAKRTTSTCDRYCIPFIDEGFYVDAVKTLVKVDKDWIPALTGTSLYIRPFIFATEPCLGVKSSEQYIFAIIMSPVGSYYKGGLSPTKILVEDEYIRSVRGGTGYVKVGGNYAAGLKSQEKAAAKGCSQVLWLDGIEKRYVEEIGTSNAFFVMGGEVWTAPLSGTILAGITRDSVIRLLKDWGMSVREERFTIDEVVKAHESGTLSEVFASGTAAVISPVGQLKWLDNDMVINENRIGPVSQKLYDTITGIQSGVLPDPFGWVVRL